MNNPFTRRSDALDQAVQITRRDFLATSASGLGTLALGSLLARDGLLARAQAGTGPMTLRPPHFAPKARACICLYMEGAPSQMDLFDPKPRLRELDGQKLPESMTKNVRFAFLRKDTATVLGSPRTFTRHGRCGMELSDLLPHLAACADDLCLIRSLHTDQFNHHPGQILMNTGSPLMGRPSMGSWLTYGLGSPGDDLPGYVVLTAGRGTSAGPQNWASGFLPSSYAGVLFRAQGDPVTDLANPPGVTRAMQHYGLDAIRDLNTLRQKAVGDPEIASRIASYELAFRLQASAPELMDLSGESAATRAAYGVDREDPPIKADRAGGPGQYRAYARNCLLARRLVERGVRFVNVFHASWDHHSNLDRELAFNAGMADQPVAALLQDLKQRGLLDTTLVLWLSEFGRTPLGENRAGYKQVTGRDHHPFAFSIWAAGGGVRGGTVVGETDELGWGITRDPVHVHDLHATLLHLFGFDHERLTYRFQGRDFRLTDVRGQLVRAMLA
ncbi:MAG: hypothetical protein RJA22_3092 [Verrucomicrobiota bacterium]